MKDVERDRLGLRKLRSPANRRVLDGLKRAADANGLPTEGRFVQYGTEKNPHAVVLGAAMPGLHPGEQDYAAAFPPTVSPGEKS